MTNDQKWKQAIAELGSVLYRYAAEERVNGDASRKKRPILWAMGYCRMKLDGRPQSVLRGFEISDDGVVTVECEYLAAYRDWETDRKSTRLNSSH